MTAIAALGATALIPVAAGEASADVGDTYRREDHYAVGSVTCTIRGVNNHYEVADAFVSATLSGPSPCRDSTIRMSVGYTNMSGNGVSFATYGAGGFVAVELFDVESDLSIYYYAVHDDGGSGFVGPSYSLPK
jgi:hypothetical protein